MKLRTLWTTAVLGVALTTSAAHAQTYVPDSDAPAVLAQGQAAPLRTEPMKAANGHAVSIADAAGKKGTLVLFVCNHCPWVRAWSERFTRIGNDAQTHGIGVIAINSNNPDAYPEDGYEQMRAKARAWGIHFPYVYDERSAVARAFGASHTPEAFLFDAGGKLVYHGAIDDNAHDAKAVEHPWLHDAVDAVAHGRDVPVAETKAMGCGIQLRRAASGT